MLIDWQLTVGGLVLLSVRFLAEGLPGTINGTNVLGLGYLIVLGSLLAHRSRETLLLRAEGRERRHCG
ncbi:hypothetical protein [Lentzea flaviverrucosa]|nr:hypothetical protein [Lentzea flaviverrucosa]